MPKNRKRKPTLDSKAWNLIEVKYNKWSLGLYRNELWAFVTQETKFKKMKILVNAKLREKRKK